MDLGRFGFGFLRLPHRDPDDHSTVDLPAVEEMVDLFLERGFRYFDTAYIYLGGLSEVYLRKALVERHPREAFLIADKLPCGYLKSGKTPEEIFEQQLARCGVDYFDVYLLHGLDGEDAEYAEKMGCFEFLEAQKKRGKVRYTGFSFHDTAEVLDRILTRHPEVDLVQIQLNYLDWDNEIIQSGACHAVCRKHGRPVLVMEPVKGGTLANIPEEAAALFRGEPPAHRALRFAASREGVAMVLSGMSDPDQVRENTALMSPFEPLTAEENRQVRAAAEIIRAAVAIPCTACGYCLEGCPAGIPIPRYFALYNEWSRDGWQVDAQGRYEALARTFPRADACLDCKQCEQSCPQKLPVTEHLSAVSRQFDRRGG